MEEESVFHDFHQQSEAALLLSMDGAEYSVCDCNDAACRLSGYAREDLIGAKKQDLLALVYSADAEMLRDEWRRHRSEERLRADCICRLTRKNGDLLWAWIRATRMETNPNLCYVLLLDFTEVKEREIALYMQSKVFNALHEQSDTLLVCFDPRKDTMFYFWNRMMYRATHYRAQCRIRPEYDALPFSAEDLYALFTQVGRSLRKRERIESEFYSLGPQHTEKRWYEMTTLPQMDAMGQVRYVFGRIEDVNDRVTERNHLSQLATTDELTGLCNRSEIFRRLDEAIQKPNAFGALLLIDVDDFKLINDSQGHWYGDFALRTLADLLRRVTPPGAAVGRYGGDEFILLLPGADEQAANAVMQALMQESRAHSINAPEGQASFSVGGALYPACGNTREKLFCAADNALYAVKNRGKNSSQLFATAEAAAAAAPHGSRNALPQEGLKGAFTMDMVDKLLRGDANFIRVIDVLLAGIGNHLGVDKIRILDFDSVANSLYCLHQWIHPNQDLPSEQSQYLPYSKDSVRQLMAFFTVDEPMQLLRVPVEQTGRTDLYAYLMQQKGLTACAHCATYRQGVAKYVFQYECFRASKDWREDEITLVRAFSERITQALSTQTRGDGYAAWAERCQNYDRLTELLTYSKMLRDAEQAIKENPDQRWCVVYTDFKEFKYINDTFGYEMGDRVLREFSALIQETQQKNGSLSCRVTHDSFAALTPMTATAEETVRMLERANQRVLERIYDHCDGIHATLATGVYCLQPGDSIHRAIDCANIARKRAKKLVGGGVVCYDDTLRQQAQEEAMMLNSLDDALQKGEFFVVYQPKIDLHTMCAVGAEGLVRWKRPNGTLMLPERFVPFYEEHGLIWKIDLYVLEKVCDFLRRRMEAGKPLMRISLNLSRFDCTVPNFFDAILRVVEASGVPHQYLEFELTETILFDHSEAISHFFADLADHGFVTTIDDFGAGSSSLSALMSMPVPVVKLDRVFMQKEESKRTEQMLYPIVQMLKQMNIETICEGVETQSHVDLCQRSGCQQAQGYWFSIPLTEAEFEYFFDQTNQETET